MSKQSQANTIYLNAPTSATRKTIIDEIVNVIGVKPAHAATMYNTAKNKAKVPTTKKPTTKKSATTHTPPVTSGATISNLSDRATLRLLRVEFQAAIDAVAASHGLTAGIGNIRFEPEGTSFTTKMTVETSGAAVKKEADKADMFNIYARSSGLEASDFGKVFEYAGKTLKIVGYNTRAKKYPISVEDMNGRGFKVSGGQIASALGH